MDRALYISGLPPTIRLFLFDLAQSKQDLANIHVSLESNWAKYTLGSPGILKLIVSNKFQIMYCNFCMKVITVIQLFHEC